MTQMETPETQMETPHNDRARIAEASRGALSRTDVERRAKVFSVSDLSSTRFAVVIAPCSSSITP